MKSNIVLFTGPIDIGKTTMLLELYKQLDQIRIAGFLTIKAQENKKYFLDLKYGIQYGYYVAEDEKDAIPIGRFFLSKTTLEKGNEIISSFIESNDELLIIDEIGKLELYGNGFYKGLINLLSCFNLNDKKIIIVVRDYLIDDIKMKFNIEPEIFNCLDDIDKLKHWVLEKT